jgi:hypothetical protein
VSPAVGECRAEIAMWQEKWASDVKKCRRVPARVAPLSVSADQRQSYICRERLIGARSFTAREIEEAMLRGRDDLRHPCDRLGPFSLYYYRQSAARAGAALRRAFSN